MTENQKSELKRLRLSGMSYAAISKAMGISEDTIKKHCRRNGLMKTPGKDCCPVCGEKLVHIQGKKQKRFCSDACRYRWWNIYRRQGGSNDSL